MRRRAPVASAREAWEDARIPPDREAGLSEVVYRSEITLVRNQGVHRTATMPGGERVDFGVHGAIAEHYGVPADANKTVSATIDYVIAAAAG